MKTRHRLLLLHPAFLLALVTLLVNDLYLKYAFHNALTEKLSDFAGLFVFTVFFIALYPRYKKPILLFCALFFCWWKSPLSGGFIFFCNHYLSLPVHRVVDYTDLTGLLVLPLAYRLKPVVYTLAFMRPAAMYLSGIVSIFAFCATSMPRYMQRDETYINKTVRTKLPQAAIEDRFREKNIVVNRDTAYYNLLTPGDKYLEIKDTLTGTLDTLHLSDHKEIALYQRSVPYDPTYTIPYLLINGDTLKNIRFSITETENHQKRIVYLHSFWYDTVAPPGYYVSQRWLKRKYQKPLKKKIEAIIKE